VKTIKQVGVLFAAALFLGLFHAMPASAQATRTWISGVGDDVNPCSRTAPCKTFQGAISKTAAGGEINCLDPGGFGNLTITKSISLICDSTETGVLVASANGIIINSATAIVTLSGFDFEGLGQTVSPGVNGVTILNAAVVHIHNSKIRGFRNGFGINFQPQASNTQLFVDNVTITESGSTGVTSGGINLNPSTNIAARATITNSRIVDNANVGIRADTSGITGSSLVVTIDNTVISNDNAGILVKAPTGTGTVKVMLTNSIIADNVSQGIIVNGTPASAQARVGNTTITGNATGILLLGTATLQSYGDNRLDGNGVDGAFSGTPIAKK